MPDGIPEQAVAMIIQPCRGIIQYVFWGRCHARSSKRLDGASLRCVTHLRGPRGFVACDTPKRVVAPLTCPPAHLSTRPPNLLLHHIALD
jgi:hypothetical protein